MGGSGFNRGGEKGRVVNLVAGAGGCQAGTGESGLQSLYQGRQCQK